MLELRHVTKRYPCGESYHCRGLLVVVVVVTVVRSSAFFKQEVAGGVHCAGALAYSIELRRIESVRNIDKRWAGRRLQAR